MNLYSKAFLVVVLLWGCSFTPALAQRGEGRDRNTLPKYIAKKTSPYFKQLKYGPGKISFWISSTKNKKTPVQTITKSKEVPSPAFYIYRAAKPFYLSQKFAINKSMSYWIGSTRRNSPIPRSSSSVVASDKSRGIKGSYNVYVQQGLKPFFYGKSVWAYTNDGVLKRTVKSGRERRKNFGKEFFPDIKLLYKQGKDKLAIQKSVKNLKLAEEKGNREQKIEIYNLLATFCVKNGLLADALNFYKSALAEQILDPELFGYGQIALDLSAVLIKQKNYEEALKYITFGKLEYQNGKINDGLGKVYLKIAEIDRLNNRLADAEATLLNSALPNFSAADNLEGRMLCFEQLGFIYYAQDRFSEAKWFFIQQKTLAEQLKDNNSLFRSLVELGKVKTSIQDYSLALEDFKDAFYLIKSSAPTEEGLRLEQAYGNLYQKQGNKTMRNLSYARSKKLKSAVTKLVETRRKMASELLKYTQDKQTVFFAIVEKETTTALR